MIPNSPAITSTNCTNTWGDTTIPTSGTRIHVLINGHIVMCRYDPETGTTYLPHWALHAGTSVVITDGYAHDRSDSTASAYEDTYRKNDRMVEFKKTIHNKAPWELEDWSPRMVVGCSYRGVSRSPPMNRPMQRQRRPPSWMRRKRR